MVMDGQVTSMDGLAQRLLSGARAAGTAARTTMDEGMRMPMP
jgi:hypothetical protein